SPCQPVLLAQPPSGLIRRKNKVEEKLIDLEIRLTHQENHIEELDKVIYQQQKTIDALSERLTDLERRLKTATENNILSQSDEVPPPHY
ncbi:MAG: SlyX family protein, partial [Gammaproteobacteria bacterium]|nr:SlyX family protein [Gammaproteobacteria bacterium]